MGPEATVFPFKFILLNLRGAHIIILFSLYVIFAILAAVIPGFLLGPLLLLFHKKTIGKSLDYFIEKRDASDTFRGSLKSLYPALMTINFSIFLYNNPVVYNFIINPEFIAANEFATVQLVSLFGATLATMTIALSIFCSVYFLLDSGIVYTNRRRVENTEEPIEVKSIGSGYHYFLKGYAGISVVISFIIVAQNLITSAENPAPQILLLVLPFQLIIFCIPAMIILDVTYDYRKKFMLKYAKKLKIETYIDLEIKKI